MPEPQRPEDLGAYLRSLGQYPLKGPDLSPHGGWGPAEFARGIASQFTPPSPEFLRQLSGVLSIMMVSPFTGGHTPGFADPQLLNPALHGMAQQAIQGAKQNPAYTIGGMIPLGGKLRFWNLADKSEMAIARGLEETAINNFKANPGPETLKDLNHIKTENWLAMHAGENPKPGTTIQLSATENYRLHPQGHWEQLGKLPEAGRAGQVPNLPTWADTPFGQSFRDEKGQLWTRTSDPQNPFHKVGKLYGQASVEKQIGAPLASEQTILGQPVQEPNRTVRPLTLPDFPRQVIGKLNEFMSMRGMEQPNIDAINAHLNELFKTRMKVNPNLKWDRPEINAYLRSTLGLSRGAVSNFWEFYDGGGEALGGPAK